jgi:hypothetical protein
VKIGCWNFEDYDDIGPLHVLLTPKLNDPRFAPMTLGDYSAELKPLIRSIQKHSPSLRHMGMITSLEMDEIPPFVDCVLPLFRSHSFLQTLELETKVFAVVVNQMPVFPELSSLSVWSNFSTDDALDSRCFQSELSYIMPSLKRICASMLDDPVPFFTKIFPATGHLIEAVTIDPYGLSLSQPTLVRLIETIGEFCPIIEELSMSTSIPEQHRGPITPSHGLLRPLLSCPKLISVNIPFMVGAVDTSCLLSDMDLSLVASVWSRIEVLCLAGSWPSLDYGASHPHVTSLSIDVIAMLCEKMSPSPLAYVDREHSHSAIGAR